MRARQVGGYEERAWGFRYARAEACASAAAPEESCAPTAGQSAATAATTKATAAEAAESGREAGGARARARRWKYHGFSCLHATQDNR
ncbi:MAG: hypothetical protein WAN93_03840, partial [Solirubrobacteraceae bacterium]